MPELELLKFAMQIGYGGIFFYLYWVTNDRLQKQADKHDADIARIQEQRIQELKLMARVPTNLEGSIPANSPVFVPG